MFISEYEVVHDETQAEDAGTIKDILGRAFPLGSLLELLVTSTNVLRRVKSILTKLVNMSRLYSQVVC